MKSLILIACLFAGTQSFSANEIAAKSFANYAAKVDATKAVHRIQLGQYEKFVPVKIVELLREIGGVVPISLKGSSLYFTSPIESEEEAAKLLPQYIMFGFDQAKHVVEYKKDIYELEIFNKMVSGDKKSVAPIVRIWK